MSDLSLTDTLKALRDQWREYVHHNWHCASLRAHYKTLHGHEIMDVDRRDPCDCGCDSLPSLDPLILRCEALEYELEKTKKLLYGTGYVPSPIKKEP